jgi:hypothetical protein
MFKKTGDGDGYQNVVEGLISDLLLKKTETGREVMLIFLRQRASVITKVYFERLFFLNV